jgi:hypothetical protein
MTMLGADVSTLQRSLHLGAKYYDDAGVSADPGQQHKPGAWWTHDISQLELGKPGQRLHGDSERGPFGRSFRHVLLGTDLVRSRGLRFGSHEHLGRRKPGPIRRWAL